MKLELSVYALKLQNVAGALKGISDPFAVVTLLATSTDSQPKALGKTEAIHNNLNPKWVKVFEIEHEMGKPCKISISVFDEEKKGSHKPMGSAIFDIDEVLGSRGNTKVKKLKKGGMIFANIRKSVGSGLVRLQMKGIKLKNVEGIFSKSDPFFELSRKVDNAGALTWDNVYRSKEIKNNLNPTWETAVIDLSILCGGNLDSPVQIEIFDFESDGKHKLMGKVEMSVNGMKNAINSNISIKHKNKDAGTLVITRCDIEGVQQPAVASSNVASVTTAMASTYIASPTSSMSSAASRDDAFVDYISGGCELNVSVAIDFTGSNGDPRSPGTLHYLGGPDRNDYQKAIAAIVSILAKYDSDQKFPVYGFGAKYGGVVRHCFQVGQTEEVHGITGILDAYNQVFSSGLIMSSPTLFDEVIDTAAARAKQSFFDAQQRKGQQSYTILLIVTDGAVSDPQRTAQALDRACDAPLSVVIVGVGNANFSSMQFLDDYNKNNGKRDVAQFVEFNRHKNNAESLTSETLHEVPTQLTSYFQSKSIAPLPPIQRSDSVLNNVDEADEVEIDLTLDIRENDVVVTGGGRCDFASGFNAR